MVYSEGYHRFPFFSERSWLIHERYKRGRILVVGCGRGYLVNELMLLGRDAYGIDIDKTRISEGLAECPHLEGHLQCGDATDPSALDQVRAMAGLGRGRRFGAAVTEDMLPSLPPERVPALMAALRPVATRRLHIITTGHPLDPRKLPDQVWRSVTEWRALLGGDPVYDTEYRRVYE